jgi:hypothetical protein
VAMAQPSRSSAGELLGLRLLVSVMGDPSLSVYRLLTLSVYIHNPDWVKRLEMRASKKVFRVLQPSLSTAVGGSFLRGCECNRRFFNSWEGVYPAGGSSHFRTHHKRPLLDWRHEMSSTGDNSQARDMTTKLKSWGPIEMTLTSGTRFATQKGRTRTLSSRAGARMNHLPALGNPRDTAAPIIRKIAKRDITQLKPKRAIPVAQPAAPGNH